MKMTGLLSRAFHLCTGLLGPCLVACNYSPDRSLAGKCDSLGRGRDARAAPGARPCETSRFPCRGVARTFSLTRYGEAGRVRGRHFAPALIVAGRCPKRFP